MKFEDTAKRLIRKYEKRVVDYHYDGTVIYPEDAVEMMREFYQSLLGEKKNVVQRAKEVEKCPHCGSENVLPILYGLPDEEGMAAIERGEVVSGGCVVGPENRRCRNCRRDFVRSDR